MKKPSLTHVCFLVVLLVVIVAPVHASSVSVESTIGDNIYIVFNFEHLDEAVYNEAKVNQLFNNSAIPQVIVKNLEKQELTSVDYSSQSNKYEDSTGTIRVSFYLGGSDIVSFELNRTTMKRTYQVRTDWRKFQINLTSSFSIDFAQHFAEPVQNWQKTNHTDSGGSTHPAFYYQTTDTNLGSLSFYFILPATAANVQALVDTVTYEVPPYFEDVFLNSPFLVLITLITIIAIVLVYRRIRR